MFHGKMCTYYANHYILHKYLQNYNDSIIFSTWSSLVDSCCVLVYVCGSGSGSGPCVLVVAVY